MAASGLSNREMAQALFVTLRTVEMHMSNVFRKLGVKTRTDVSAVLASAGASDIASSRDATASHS